MENETVLTLEELDLSDLSNLDDLDLDSLESGLGMTELDASPADQTALREPRQIALRFTRVLRL